MNQPICVVFAGRQGLNNMDSRFSIARIPEVSSCLREAQTFFDEMKGMGQKIDLYSFLLSSDDEFSMRPKLRSLVAAIVQVGLFQRYTKFYGSPSFMVGNTNGASALNVCSGKMTFQQMLEQSPFVQNLENEADENDQNLSFFEDLTLTGLSLEEYGIVKRSETEYFPVNWSTKDCYNILQQMQQDYQVEQFIHVGPHFDFRTLEMEKRDMKDMALSNSVDMDPILNSFWKTA